MAIYICDGYWKPNLEFASSKEPFFAVAVNDGTWNGVEDGDDEGIFFYTDGLAVVGDHGEFVITSATKAIEE